MAKIPKSSGNKYLANIIIETKLMPATNTRLDKMYPMRAIKKLPIESFCFTSIKFNLFFYALFKICFGLKVE